MSEHVVPIAHDELLYRRIHASPKERGYFDPSRDSHPSPFAFHPNARDVGGISVSRANSPAHPEFLTAAQAARGRSSEGYFIAVLRVADLRAAGIEVVPRPTETDPGHAELPGLNYPDRKSDEVKEWEQLLAARLTLRVEGPFVGNDENPPQA